MTPYSDIGGDNHHHIVCGVCGTATDVDCAVRSAPCLDPARNNHLEGAA